MKTSNKNKGDRRYLSTKRLSKNNKRRKRRQLKAAIDKENNKTATENLKLLSQSLLRNGINNVAISEEATENFKEDCTQNEATNFKDESFEVSECVSDEHSYAKRITETKFNSYPTDFNIELCDDVVPASEKEKWIESLEASEASETCTSSTDEESSDEKTFTSTNDKTREILEFDHFTDELLNASMDHISKNNCFYKIKCTSRRRMGLKTKFNYRCKKCNYETSIWSESPDTSNEMSIDKAAVVGTVYIGIGQTQLENLLAAMNIYCMSEKTYKVNQVSVLETLKIASLESMRLAGEEEKKLALENNQVHNGIPWIRVIVDGSWMTRSYGTNYDSLSGLAVIIGARTGKVLFVGIRNKYCSTCEFAERYQKKAKPHLCFKNWDRDAPSTAMESDVILEGFQSSMNDHGLIYKVIVSDGDSNVYKNILDNNVYKEFNIIPTRIRCYNHLQRNLCNKIRAISKTTQPKGTKKIDNFVTLRNVIGNKVLTIRKLIEESVDYRKDEQGDWNLRKKELQQDILNTCSHVFGEHKNCNNRSYVCEEKDKPIHEREHNYVPDLQKTGMYQKVEEAIQTMSNFSESVLHKLTNNIAESFNALVCADIGGKRINFGLTSQYNTRVYGAVLRHNTQQVLTEVYNQECNNVPDLIQNLDKKRQLKVSKTRERRITQGRKRKFTSKKNACKHYGPKSQEVDLSEEDMMLLRENHFKRLFENQKNREEIERNTRDQYNSMQWICMRRQLLTASHFGVVIRSKESTSCAAKVISILYPSTQITQAMQFGLDHEKDALRNLEEILNTKILPCGLHIDPVHSFLACTPDGKIGKDGIVEVKCSLAAAQMSVENAITVVKCLKSIFKKNNGIYVLNKNHHYYYQVQGQLHITRTLYCIFALWTETNIMHVRVERDDEFWNTKMEPYLLRFYHECMLPEILDSRYNRSMPLREPDYVRKAKEAIVAQKGKDNCKRKAVNNNDDHIKSHCQKEKKISFSDESLTQKDATVHQLNVDKKEKKEANNIDEDLVFSKCIHDYEWTIEDARSALTFIEAREITLQQVADNVLPVNEELDDDSLDKLIRLIQKKQSVYRIQSVLFISYPMLVEPLLENKGIAIIGGNCIHHWRVAYNDGDIIKIYDTLTSHTEETLHEDEKLYLQLRFPKAKKVIFQPMRMQQPDATSCGAYSAAIAVDIVLGVNPSLVEYSLDTKKIRSHFIRLITDDKLSEFPRQ